MKKNGRELPPEYPVKTGTWIPRNCVIRTKKNSTVILFSTMHNDPAINPGV